VDVDVIWYWSYYTIVLPMYLFMYVWMYDYFIIRSKPAMFVNVPHLPLQSSTSACQSKTRISAKAEIARDAAVKGTHGHRLLCQTTGHVLLPICTYY